MMINEYLADTVEAIARLDVGEINNAILILQDAKINGNTVWVVGNGGSAATAEHFACDLVKVAGIRAIAVPSLTSSVTAFGNDESWERMFSAPLARMAKRDDVLVAISCSGESQNVIQAAQLFPKASLIILTGDHYNSILAQMEANAKIFVRDDDIRIQEDAHLTVCHCIAGELRKS